ncbi:MAG: MopE-related protein [Myxococcota bacterium]
MRHPSLVLLPLALAGCPNEVEISDKMNRPPVVSISDPADGSTYSEVDRIDLVGVVADADGMDDIVSLVWSSDRMAEPLATLDDAPPDAAGFTHIARSLPPGNHAITLSVIDAGGLQALASIGISVSPQDVVPSADIAVPLPGATFDPGEEITLAGSASDPNQPPETLTATWSYSVGGGPSTEIASGAPNDSGSTTAIWTDAPVGELELRLVVTDDEGNAAEAQLVVVVKDPYSDDLDHDGVTTLAGDCDDQDPNRSPTLDEVCDGVDNDCNDVIDDKDLDFDEHVDEACTAYPGLLPVDDCDDTHGTVFPGAAEQGDDLDNDCDGEIDDGLSEYDNDGDCFCTAASCTGSINGDCATLAPGDCDDTDAALHDRDDDLDGASPCDGDCDDLDPGLNGLDADGDGFSSCAGDCNDLSPILNPDDGDADGASSCAGDCNDSNALLNVLDADLDGASSCDGDCDDGAPGLNVLDIDADGWTSCDGDCNDADASVSPTDADGDGASSCAGDCDDSDASLNLDDVDLDGFDSCSADCDDSDPVATPADADLDGTSSCAGDCNDLNSGLNVDDVDNDGASSCDGDCNDTLPALNLNDADGDEYSTCAGDCNDGSGALNPADADGDGWSTCELDCDDGDASVEPADVDGDGWSTCDADCDDVDASVHPTAPDVPYNGVDDDCANGDLVDVDGDGFDASVVGGDDCDDSAAAVNPSADESCNTVDDDCDGKTDENGSTGCISYFADGDADGFGVVPSRCQCGPNTTSGFTATVNGDCYDANPDVFPGQPVSFYPDRGDGSWDYDCDTVEETIDDRTTLYDCYLDIVIFPPSVTCFYTNGWETAAPGCGTNANWASGCLFTLSSELCSPATFAPVDQTCN